MVVTKVTKGDPVTKKSEAATTKRPKRNEKGWQAEKSAITRLAILEATIQCLLELGYANTTTALIANYAGLSRGAMMHHFPSRMSVMRAVVDHLHQLRLQEYLDLMVDIDDPQRTLTHEVIRKSVEAAWLYVNLPSFLAYQELLSASRTDAELRQVIDPVEKDFEKQFLDTAKAVFPHWQNLSRLEGAHDMVQFLMKGMALSQITVGKKVRAKRVITYLTAILYDLYLESNLIE
jgi:AcrR family transcriptional regulator